MIITSLRTYLKDETRSRIFVDGQYYDEGLEDAGRPTGVKVYAETCIPEGCFRVLVNVSRRFNKLMVMIFDHAPDLSVRRFGVKYTGIRAHRGKHIGHTAGCILMSRADELTLLVEAAIQQGEPVYWVFTEDCDRVA